MARTRTCDRMPWYFKRGLGHGHKRSRARSLQTVFTLSEPKYFFAHLKVNQSESV